jgi:hypothetical protein
LIDEIELLELLAIDPEYPIGTLSLTSRTRSPLGPTLAHEKLAETHDLALLVETLQGWMIDAGLWLPRAQRARRSYPPRERRPCLGELAMDATTRGLKKRPFVASYDPVSPQVTRQVTGIGPSQPYP